MALAIIDIGYSIYTELCSNAQPKYLLALYCIYHTYRQLGLDGPTKIVTL